MLKDINAERCNIFLGGVLVCYWDHFGFQHIIFIYLHGFLKLIWCLVNFFGLYYTEYRELKFMKSSPVRRECCSTERTLWFKDLI